MNNLWIVFFFGFLFGASVVMVIFRFCLADIERQLREIISDEEELVDQRPKPRQ